MKTVFIEAKHKGIVKLTSSIISKLPKKVGLVSTIQFLHNLPSIKRQLTKEYKTAIIGGQIIGCNFSKAAKIKNKVDCFLFIGTGEFHPLGLAFDINKPIYILNPISLTLTKISKYEVEAYKKRRKGAYLKFLTAKNIGILVTTKQGQSQLNNAIALKNKLKDKSVYLFLTDTLDINQLENFPFIDAWVNTACPRIIEDKVGIINLEEIK